MYLAGLFLQVFGSIVIIITSNFIWAYIKSPIKNIPGPFFAKFTNLWRFFDTWGGRPDLTQRILHERHGAAVRMGPNMVSLSDPKLLRTIYNVKGNYLKVYFTIRSSRHEMLPNH